MFCFNSLVDEPNNLNSGILKPIDVGEYDGCKAMILPGLEDDLQIWYEGIDIFLWNEVCNIAWDLVRIHLICSLSTVKLDTER